MMIRNRLKKLYITTHVKLCGPEAYPLHDHDFGEVAWVDEGSCSHVVNGTEVKLTKGDLFFIRPPDSHRYQSPRNEPFFLNNIGFKWPIYESIKQRYFSGNGEAYGEEGRLPKVLHLGKAQLAWARQAYVTLLKAPVSLISIERFLIDLFSELCPVPEDDFLQNAPSWMRSAWQTIRHPEHLRLGVPEFYRLCSRCPEHVSREFHKQTGQTLVQSIGRLRMDHGAALLAGTTREIVEVAQECGFESLSHFYVCFRRCHGVTPLNFRKRAQLRMYEE